MDKIEKITIIIGVIIVFLILICSVIFSLINISNTKILKGISINNIDISGMTKDEAISAISEVINEKKQKNIIISTSSDSQITSTFEYLEINYDINSYVNEAYNLGRKGNIFENNFEILNLLINKKNINIEVQLNEEKLNTLANDISANLTNKVIQSGYYIEDNNLIITKGSNGVIIDQNNLEKQLYEVLNDINKTDNFINVSVKDIEPDSIDIEQIYNEVHKDVQNAYYEKQPLKIYSEVAGISFDKEKARELLNNDQNEYKIELEYTYPEITVSDLDIDIFKDTLSYFPTNYDTSNKDRETNLELAAEKINGTILLPGEEFSYNTIVGARTIDKGYKEAKIYSNGKVVDGLGGGICQISTTIYNSAIFANLEITERYNHQFITSYVPAGRDATVVYGVKDLKFKNNRLYPIKIEIKVNNGIASCSIYGIEEENEYNIDFDIETISTTPPTTIYEKDVSVERGKEKTKQKGTNGSTVNVYKVLKQGGSIISKTLLSQDTYKPLEKIILKNPND